VLDLGHQSYRTGFASAGCDARHAPGADKEGNLVPRQRMALVMSLSGILGGSIDIWKILMQQLPLYLSILLLQAASRCGATDGSSDWTWSQGLTLGVNGPIPVIVVDQFGYPTKAAKIAVIRNPQVGYDSMVHFTPGQNYAVVNRTTGAIVKRGTPTVWNNGATDTVSGDKAKQDIARWR